MLIFIITFGTISTVRGVWRSLVARTAGGREVAGSNPVAPIYAVKSRVCGLGMNECSDYL